MPGWVDITEHICNNTDGFYIECVDGEIYGYCEAETCYGSCGRKGLCDCTCHDEKEVKANAERTQA